MTACRVRAVHIQLMAHRMCASAQDRLMYLISEESTRHQKAVRAYERRFRALRRLSEALERQDGGPT